MAASVLPRAVLLAAALAWLTACSGLSALNGKASALSSDEQEAVREQAEKALAEGRFNAAWNEEVAAGADRERLEAVAVAALEARSRHAKAMFDALRARFGSLGSGPRGRIEALVMKAREAGSWHRALSLEIESADDPPTYQAAWALYRAAPPDLAPSLLEAIQAARDELKESAD